METRKDLVTIETVTAVPIAVLYCCIDHPRGTEAEFLARLLGKKREQRLSECPQSCVITSPNAQGRIDHEFLFPTL